MAEMKALHRISISQGRLGKNVRLFSRLLLLRAAAAADAVTAV